MKKRHFGLKRSSVDKLNCLKWIIEEFLTTDLKNLPYFKRFSFIENIFICIYSVELKELTSMDVAESKKSGSSYYGNVISFDRLLSEDLWNAVIGVQKVIKQICIKDLFPLIEGKTRQITLPIKSKCHYILVNVNGILELNLFFPTYIKSKTPFSYMIPSASYNFFELMEKVPINAIRTCRECKKVFVQLKGKKREFCCDKHMYRWHTRERRKGLKESQSTKKETP